MFNLSDIIKFTRSILPRGKAFLMPKGGTMEKLFEGIGESETRLLNDITSTFDHVIPDNDNFTIDDAKIWEKRLGIKSSDSVGLTAKKTAILQKLNYPNSPNPRQHYKFIEDQLRSAGFGVRIYENNFSGITMSPDEILSAIGMEFMGTDSLHGDDIMHTGYFFSGVFHDDSLLMSDDEYHGAGYSEFVVNHIDEQIDREYLVGSNWRSTFYVAGDNFPEFGDVPTYRKEEFRHLLLQLKPTQTIGILFINYI